MQYQAPDTVDAAVAALSAAGGQARVMAGGTDLLVQLRSGRVSPGQIIDLKQIPEMRAITIDDEGLQIGAAVSGAELGERHDVIAHWPGIVEAFELIGSTQIQGRATMGGNLCNASPAADSVPALIAAGAQCVIAGPHGRRTVPVEDLVVAPGKNSLAAGELLVAFRLSPRVRRSGDAYLRFIPRTEMDIAVAGAGVWIALDDSGRCTGARIALGAVAPRAMLVEAAGDCLMGSTVDATALDRAVDAARAACAPIDDKRGTAEFRVQVAGVLVRRAALVALERAKDFPGARS